jgi:hypothetical protein
MSGEKVGLKREDISRGVPLETPENRKKGAPWIRTAPKLT